MSARAREKPRPKTVSSPRWTLAATILASSLSFVDGSVLNVALPAIRASYGAGAAEVQWVVNAYLLPLSALLLLGGALGDHYGRRLLLVIGTSLFGAASLVCALAPSLEILLAARGAQGIGAALLLPNSLALLNAAYQGEKRGRAVGIWAAAGAAAAAVAPLLGGWLVDHVGWPAIFYINLPLATGAIFLAVRFVTESKDDGAARTDYAGAILATAGLGGTTYGLTLWSSSGSLPLTAIASIVVGLVLFVLFLGVERRRGDKAMMPLGMFADPCFSGLNLLTLASPPMGQLAMRIGPRWPLIIGPLVVGGGMLLGQRIGSDTNYWTAAFPAITVMSIGMAIAVAPLTSSVLGSVKEKHVGLASGFNSAVARTGGLIATALLGVVLRRDGEALIDGFHLALIGSAIAAAGASLSALFLVGNVKMRKA